MPNPLSTQPSSCQTWYFLIYRSCFTVGMPTNCRTYPFGAQIILCITDSYNFLPGGVGRTVGETSQGHCPMQKAISIVCNLARPCRFAVTVHGCRKCLNKLGDQIRDSDGILINLAALAPVSHG